MSALKLATSHGRKVGRKRNIHTHYRVQGQSKPRATTSCEVATATRSAVMRCLRKEYRHAEVFDQRGRLAVTVGWTPTGLNVTVHLRGVL